MSLLNIADGALEQLGGITIRLKELAEQAANGTYGVKQRKSLDAEAQALSKEYFRIVRSTTFNGRGVFFAEFGDLRLQGGYGTNGGIQSGLGGAIGTGKFEVGVSYATETLSSNSVAVGDLNGDGLADLVTAGLTDGPFSDGYVTVQLGNGDGSFAAAASYTTEDASSLSLALGDLNGDGVLDLVSTGIGANGFATVRLGDGTGKLGAATSYATNTTTSNSVTLGDLNGDGTLDLVTAGYDTISLNGIVTVRLGSGNGTFGNVTSYLEGEGMSYAVRLGDLNADGILDIVSAGRTISGIASIRLGTGNGSFGSATSFSMEATGSRNIALGDLNGDGRIDLVTVGYSGSDGYSTVRLGNGNGTFGNAISYGSESKLSLSASLGDLNGDGFLDLVTAGQSDANTGVSTIRLGDGTGSFGTATSYSTEAQISRAIILADLNQDGVLDIVTAGTDGSDGYVTRFLSSIGKGVSPLLDFKLTSRADALQALSQFGQAVNRLSIQRGTIGAFESRLSVAANILQASTENYAAATGRIKDADVADESSRLIRTQILQQAASAVLAQANQQPALALQLLA
jgi:flagellin-like hook-associated protein FlgL